MRKISDILKDKGADVTTVKADALVSEAVSILADRRIGAIPVSEDGQHLQGILSERDVVRALAAGDISSMRVEELMTSTVHTCSPESRLSEVMTLMDDRRIRHVPVVENDVLVGILSIRDLVAARLRETEAERQLMADYIADRASS